MTNSDRALLVALAARFDPRIVQPDVLARRAFARIWRTADGTQEDLQAIRREAGWAPEHWPTPPGRPVLSS